MSNVIAFPGGPPDDVEAVVRRYLVDMGYDESLAVDVARVVGEVSRRSGPDWTIPLELPGVSELPDDVRRDVVRVIQHVMQRTAEDVRAQLLLEIARYELRLRGKRPVF